MHPPPDRGNNAVDDAPQVRLIRHADIRRLLLTQKAYAEGALALCLLASALFEDQRTHPYPAERERAALDWTEQLTNPPRGGAATAWFSSRTWWNPSWPTGLTR